MPKPIRVLVVGLGQIGAALARTLLSEPGLRLASAVDPAPGLAGRPLREVLDDARAGPGLVRTELSEAPAADVAVVTTASTVRAIAPVVLAAVRRRLHVVSSCEELAYPWTADPRLARRLDWAARKAGVVVLGTGVNPGFVLDRLVLTLASAALDVERVCAERVVDLATRRPALRQKCLVGASLQGFEEARRRGGVGHVGLEASARLVAAGLGWSADRYLESLDPLIADRRLRGPGYDVAAGDVAGVLHRAVLLEGRLPRVLYKLQLSVDAERPRDAVVVEGRYAVRAELPGGLPGDPATIATLVRGVARVGGLSAGLRTPGDLPAAPVRPAARRPGVLDRV
jgi:4-hydroxy-tetrahydrodipicolinate reductase